MEPVRQRIGGHFSTVGAAALPIRLMAGLLYLQHLHNLSDEMTLGQWLESPYYQYFCGETFFQHDFPRHPTSLVKWRKRSGEEGCEWLLTQTIEAGLKLKAINPASLKRVVVDTTLQEKNHFLNGCEALQQGSTAAYSGRQRTRHHVETNLWPSLSCANAKNWTL